MKRSSIFAQVGLSQENEYFIEQLSMLLTAGVPVMSALSAILKEKKSSRFRSIVSTIADAIESGSTIATALEETEAFPLATISLIRSGEQSGRLAENMNIAVDQQQKDRVFRSKISSAVMYPIFVFVLTIVVGLAVAWFILPRLATVFSQMNVPLPAVTKWLISTGVFLNRYGLVVVPSAVGIVILLCCLLFLIPETNFMGQAILFAIGPIARLIQEMELSRFGYLMGSLLDAGLPIEDSLKSLIQSTTLYRYKRLYVYLCDAIGEGISFEKCFDTYAHTDSLIPVVLQQLIVTGEQSGSLPETFRKIGTMYEAKAEITMKNITTLLEPVLLVVVWLGVVMVAVGVILPLYSLIGNFNP